MDNFFISLVKSTLFKKVVEIVFIVASYVLFLVYFFKFNYRVLFSNDFITLFFLGHPQDFSTNYYSVEAFSLLFYGLLFILLVRNVLFKKKHNFSIFLLSFSYSVSLLVYLICSKNIYHLFYEYIIFVAFLFLAIYFAFQFFMDVELSVDPFKKINFILKCLLIFVGILFVPYLFVIYRDLVNVFYNEFNTTVSNTIFVSLVPSPIFICYLLSIVLLIALFIYKKNLQKRIIEVKQDV